MGTQPSHTPTALPQFAPTFSWRKLFNKPDELSGKDMGIKLVCETQWSQTHTMVKVTFLDVQKLHNNDKTSFASPPPLRSQKFATETTGRCLFSMPNTFRISIVFTELSHANGFASFPILSTNFGATKGDLQTRRVSKKNGSRPLSAPDKARIDAGY